MHLKGKVFIVTKKDYKIHKVIHTPCVQKLMSGKKYWFTSGHLKLLFSTDHSMYTLRLHAHRSMTSAPSNGNNDIIGMLRFYWF